MIVAAVRETFPGERRVALVPGVDCRPGQAGRRSAHRNRRRSGSRIHRRSLRRKRRQDSSARAEALAADCLLQVRALGANPLAGAADVPLLHAGQVVIGMCDPLGVPEAVKALAERGVTLFSLELVPRITRAQSMDVLSSQATVAGYRAVLLAATTLRKMFPMMTTAAGTITPAKVFVVGAGVAGLQAIATARRAGRRGLRPTTSARPSRSRCKASVAKFVEMELAAGKAEAAGGYAKAMDEEFYRRQRELMTQGRGRARRRDHHRGRARQESADTDHRRDGGRPWRPAR